MTSSGYTLPVWVAAAAVAAVRLLRGEGSVLAAVPLWLQPDQASAQLPQEPIDVEAAALLAPDRALGISRCQPGDGLDLTRGLAVWVEAHWTERLAGQPWLQLEAGEGVGVLAGSSELCVSGFARALLECNLQPLVPDGVLTHRLQDGFRHRGRAGDHQGELVLHGRGWWGESGGGCAARCGAIHHLKKQPSGGLR